MDEPLPESGGWNGGRIGDLSLAQGASQLTEQKHIWLPTMKQSDAFAISITEVAEIAEVGPIHRDINGTNPNGSIRGPFKISPLKPGQFPTYPPLSPHKADRQRTMLFHAVSDAPLHAVQ